MALLNSIAELLRRFPEIAVFVTLGLGYLVGSYKIRGFGLGTVVGTLIVGMIVGQAHVDIPTFARSLFFLLFMFATGYQVGPQFFVSLRRGGIKLLVIALVFAFVGILTTILVAWFLKLDGGFTGGLLSGALTQSSVIGTASEAIEQLPLGREERDRLIAHVPVADAVTYLFGTIGVTLLLTKAFPAIMKVDLRVECEKFEKELGGALESSEEQLGFAPAVGIDVQAFRITQPGFVDRPIADLLAAVSPRVQVPRIHRRERAFAPDKRLSLKLGDVLAISGPREDVIRTGQLLGEQVVDPLAMEVPYQVRNVFVTNPRAVGATLGDLRARDVHQGAGVHLRRVTRQGEELPILAHTTLARADVLQFIGTSEALNRITPLFGIADVPTDKTNFLAIGLTIAIGALIGTFAIHLGSVPIGLGTGGGALIAGLAFGWLQSHFPRLGRIPPASVWLMQNLGLNTFIAMVGLVAGPHAVEAMKSSGLQLLLASVVVATVPHVLSFIVGHYFFRLNAGQLMGALAGAGTITAALQSLVEECDSPVPVLGYSVPFAINNILLTAGGPIVVAASQLWSS
jgi:putative transport protein